MGYRLLADFMRPIEPIIDRTVTPHNPCQNTNPTTSHVMYVPNIPRSSAPRTQPSISISSLPSSAGGKPSSRPMLSSTIIISSQGQTSGIDQSTFYVPPTNTNVVNPPSSLGQPLELGRRSEKPCHDIPSMVFFKLPYG